MNVNDFVRKWEAAKGGERASAQSHFIDLCQLLGEPTPTEGDPSGDFYAFEKGARTPDGNGFADVWSKDHFAWEYKGKQKDLGAAYKQVSDYREALGNPPLLVVCDFDRYEIHTNWTSTEKWIYRFKNADIATDDPVDVFTVTGAAAKGPPKLSAIQVLKALWEQPDALRPNRTSEEITEEAASIFGNLSAELRKWKVDDMRIARFITRVVFCMFATDVGLLPKSTFSDLLSDDRSRKDNKGFRESLRELFAVMNTGGKFGVPTVPHFNGRLFEDPDVPDEITSQEIIALGMLDALNWAEVEPAIFGTLFEGILDPSLRKKLGAHYTSRADIELIVEPVLMAPLRREWDAVKRAIEDYLYKAETRKADDAAQTKHIRSLLDGFHERLATIRVLDPACGSGNFLYVSLALLKALEKEVLAFASIHEVKGMKPRVHPRQLYGLEKSHYAVELTSIVIWIGYLQWKHRNVLPFDDEEPILQPLDQIQLMDAIVDESDPKGPREPEWPAADVIVGNPPFLGSKQLRKNLGDEYVERMFAVWDERVARESDLCCYWFEKARALVEAGEVKRVGLLATQAIRGGKNRRVLERIKETGDIFYAQADRKWIQDGVAVRVSMVGFDDGTETRRYLNEVPDDEPLGALDRAAPVEGINANLTSRSDTTQARRLKENSGMSFMGDTKVGPFEISEKVAQSLLRSPNPHGRANSEVVRPWVNGLDITRRPRNLWIIDFPPGTSEGDAAMYEAPFEYIQKHVKSYRATARSGDATGVAWWIHQRPRPDMRAALSTLDRYIATPNLTKYRFFVWLGKEVLPDHQLIVFARDDDYFFGVLHSRAHEVWARKQGTQLREVSSGFRYTPTSCFETFPFPLPDDAQREAIAKAARELNEWRNAWLNPSTDGLGMTQAEQKRRTLTNLYNERPAWLANAHAVLDAAVFEAYGWHEPPAELSDQQILARLLALNLQREPA
jgi:hypothetical protein